MQKNEARHRPKHLLLRSYDSNSIMKEGDRVG